MQGEEEDKIKTNIFWSECVTLVLQSPPSVWVYSHRQPLKETLGTRVHLSWDMDQGLERLSWLNHQGPLTDKQTFGSCRPTYSSTNSFRTKKSAGTLYNSGSISVRGEKIAGRPCKLQTLIWTFTVCNVFAPTSKVPWCAQQLLSWSHLGG